MNNIGKVLCIGEYLFINTILDVLEEKGIYHEYILGKDVEKITNLLSQNNYSLIFLYINSFKQETLDGYRLVTKNKPINTEIYLITDDYSGNSMKYLDSSNIKSMLYHPSKVEIFYNILNETNFVGPNTSNKALDSVIEADGLEKVCNIDEVIPLKNKEDRPFVDKNSFSVTIRPPSVQNEAPVSNILKEKKREEILKSNPSIIVGESILEESIEKKGIFASMKRLFKK